VQPLHPVTTNHKIQTNNSRSLQVLFISNFYRNIWQRKIFIEKPSRLSQKRVVSPSILPHFNRNYEMSTTSFGLHNANIVNCKYNFPMFRKKTKKKSYRMENRMLKKYGHVVRMSKYRPNCRWGWGRRRIPKLDMRWEREVETVMKRRIYHLKTQKTG